MTKHARYFPAYADFSLVARGDTFFVADCKLTILGWDVKSRRPYVIVRDAHGDLKIANARELGEANIFWRLSKP